MSNQTISQPQNSVLHTFISYFQLWFKTKSVHFLVKIFPQEILLLWSIFYSPVLQIIWWWMSTLFVPALAKIISSRIKTEKGKVTFIVVWALQMHSLLQYGITSSNKSADQHVIMRGSPWTWGSHSFKWKELEK